MGSSEFLTTTADAEIKIMVPPVNMSLVHRWIANWEMCSNLMGRPFDRNNNYRCSYVGPGNNGGYYDVGQSQFWDTVEMGCNYTATSNACGGGNIYGCIDITNGPPNVYNAAYNAASCSGNVFYDRVSSACYISDGVNWIAANSASPAQLAVIASNRPGLPPLVNLNPSQSWIASQQMSISGLGVKRLPKHSEQVTAGAWSPFYSDSFISMLESGTTSPSLGYCNSNGGNGLTFEAGTMPASNNLDTLPGATSGVILSVRTGSTTTQNCLSFYGIQDIVGNVWEWSSDQTTNCDSSSHDCLTTQIGTVDPTNTDWYWNGGTLRINFDGIIAPGGQTEGEWNFSSLAYNATNFLAPLGPPLMGGVASSYDSLAVGLGIGEFNPVHFHNNRFYLYTDSWSGNARSVQSGGYSAAGAQSGRFSLNMSLPSGSSYYDIGFRSMINVGN